MSVTDELVANNERYAERFDKGDLPLPPAKQLAVVACMDARLHVSKLLGLEEGDAHIRPFIPHKESVRGFVYDVTTGHLREVSPAK